MFAPFAVAGRLVMDARQEVEVLKRYLLLLDAQLVLQLPLGCTLHTHDRIGQVGTGLARDAQWMGAACVCPHVGEGDFLGGALLEEQLVLVVEQETGEGPVKQTLVDVGH